MKLSLGLVLFVGLAACEVAPDAARGTSAIESSDVMGGCSADQYYAKQFQRCSAATDCTCGLACVMDPQFGAKLCETPCAATADCPDTGALCVGGTCSLHICNRQMITSHTQPTNEPLYTPCDATAVGSRDGTCLPYNVTQHEEDLCIIHGERQVGESCDINVVRENAGGGCVTGAVCVVNGASGIIATAGSALGTCAPGCDPRATTSTCPMGTTCKRGDRNLGHIGFCQ